MQHTLMNFVAFKLHENVNIFFREYFPYARWNLV